MAKRNMTPKQLANLTGKNSFNNKELASAAGKKGAAVRREKRNSLQWLNFLADNYHVFNNETMEGSEIAATSLFNKVKEGDINAIKEWFNRLHGQSKLPIEHTGEEFNTIKVNIIRPKDE